MINSMLKRHQASVAEKTNRASLEADPTGKTSTAALEEVQTPIDDTPERPEPERVEGFEKLAKHHFVDLYLTTGIQTTRPVIKGLIRSNEKKYSTMPGFQKMPQHLMEDTLNFGLAIAAKFDETQAREFALTYEGVNYRVSMIEKPESSLGRPEDVRTSTNWCIRQISSSVPDIKDLSFAPSIVRPLLEMRKDRGLCIIAGSFASGKSTTAAVTFDNWVTLEKDVGITLEDPIEFPMARVTEDRGIIYQIDLTERPLEQAIKSSKRWSPRFMMLGEVRTSEAATEMLQMAISGPMLICTIHANDLISSVMSLVKFASAQMSEQAARELVAASIHTVIHQEFRNGRLVQKMMRVAGEENFGLRKKIETGMFQHLRDDIGRQEINRSKGG